MNQLRNRVQLIGRLGNDPEVKSLENGKSLAKFSIATNDYYVNDKGDRVEDTQWHNVIAWGKKAELVSKHLKKGEEVALEGKLIHRSYETSTGEKRYVTEINMSQMLMLSNGRKE